MSTFVVAHGAWSAGWAWKKMHPLLNAGGHDLVTPTYTGLGERGHLANPSIDLDTHIRDVIGVLEYEDLQDVILIGHSYGGMVATGVADRARNRVAQLVYLDAFVPHDGQCLFDLVSEQAREGMFELAESEGSGWRVPPNPLPADTSEEDTTWAMPRRLPQPIKTLQQPLTMIDADLAMMKNYIYCTRSDTFAQFAKRAQQDKEWRYFELDASHNPHITAPDALAAVLDQIAAT
jgi:pimeloyl-ACP methyl ester carboxylesterase